MAKNRPCPKCGSFHRKKAAAKRCFRRLTKGKQWSTSELGL